MLKKHRETSCELHPSFNRFPDHARIMGARYIKYQYLSREYIDHDAEVDELPSFGGVREIASLCGIVCNHE